MDCKEQTAALVTLALDTTSLTRKKGNLADGEGEDEVMHGTQVQTAAFVTLALALDTTSAKAIFQDCLYFFTIETQYCKVHLYTQVKRLEAPGARLQS